MAVFELLVLPTIEPLLHAPSATLNLIRLRLLPIWALCALLMDADGQVPSRLELTAVVLAHHLRMLLLGVRPELLGDGPARIAIFMGWDDTSSSIRRREVEDSSVNPVHLGQESEFLSTIVFPGTRYNLCVHTIVFTCRGTQMFTFNEV